MKIDLDKDFYENKYKHIYNYFKGNEKRERILRSTYILLPHLFVFIYLIFLLKVKKDYGFKGFLAGAFVPLLFFVSVSKIREKINRKRPYEKYDYTPVIEKKKTGKSMPSRHTLSAGVIAATVSFFYPCMAPLMWGMAVLVAVVRVLAGVHYISDVAVSLFISVFAGKLLKVIYKK